MKKHIKNLTIFVLGTLIVATVFFAVKASAMGSNLVGLEEESSALSQKNQDLKDQIVMSTSLSQVSSQAGGLGLIKPEKFIYMSNQGIALR